MFDGVSFIKSILTEEKVRFNAFTDVNMYGSGWQMIWHDMMWCRKLCMQQRVNVCRLMIKFSSNVFHQKQTDIMYCFCHSIYAYIAHSCLLRWIQLLLWTVCYIRQKRPTTSTRTQFLANEKPFRYIIYTVCTCRYTRTYCTVRYIHRCYVLDVLTKCIN